MFNGNFLKELEDTWVAIPSFLKFDLQRLQKTNSDQRLYFLNNDPEERLFLNCTGFCDAVLPSSSHLIDWRVEQADTLSREIADVRFRLATEYGSIFHICVAYIVRKIGENPENWKVSNISNLCEDIATQYLAQNCPAIPIKSFMDNYSHTLHKDVTCFCQFAIDYKLRVIASEFRVVDYDNFIAGTLDLAAQITVKGQTITYIIDFKSGKKGFYDKHALQLAFLMHAWNKMAKLYGGMPTIERIANFAPKNYQKADKPTYSFEDQTDSLEVKCLPLYFELAKTKGIVKSKTPKGIFWKDGKPYFEKLLDEFTFSANSENDLFTP